MRRQQHVDILIVGGGMVGATVATALGDQQLRIAVFDQALPTPIAINQPPDLRVSALNTASERLLQQLDVWRYLPTTRLCPYQRMAVWEQWYHPAQRAISQTVAAGSRQRRFNRVVFDAIACQQPQLGFIIENRVLQLGLHQAMACHATTQLFCPVTIRHIDLASSRPTLTLEDGRCFTGDLLIGADGAHSRVKQAAGLMGQQSDYPQHCLMAIVEIKPGPGTDRGIAWQAFTPTGPEALLPLPTIGDKHFAAVIWYHTPARIRQLQATSDQRFITALQATFPEELPEVIAVHARGKFALVKQHTQPYFRPGVVVIGDAAHTIHPLAGQGVNLGLQDAAWLAEVILAGHSVGESVGSHAVLARYNNIRRPANQRMLQLMDGFYHTFSHSNGCLKLIRNLGLSAVGHLPPVMRQIMRYGMGLAGQQPRLVRGLPAI